MQKMPMKRLDIGTKQIPIDDDLGKERVAIWAENERLLLLWGLLQCRREHTNIALHGLFYKSSWINQFGDGWGKNL